jgi:hypothetical protein
MTTTATHPPGHKNSSKVFANLEVGGKQPDHDGKASVKHPPSASAQYDTTAKHPLEK